MNSRNCFIDRERQGEEGTARRGRHGQERPGEAGLRVRVAGRGGRRAHTGSGLVA